MNLRHGPLLQTTSLLRRLSALWHGLRRQTYSGGDLGGTVRLGCHALVVVCDHCHALTTADVFELLVSAFELRFEDLDRGLELARLAVAGARRLLHQVVFFAHLSQRALQVKDLFFLLLEFLGDGDLFFEGDTFLRVGEGGLVQGDHQRRGLVEGCVLARKL